MATGPNQKLVAFGEYFLWLAHLLRPFAAIAASFEGDFDLPIQLITAQTIAGVTCFSRFMGLTISQTSKRFKRKSTFSVRSNRVDYQNAL